MRRLALSVPLLLFLLPASLSLHGQAPVIQWQKIWGSSNGDYANVIRPTSDGGYIIVGYTEGPDEDVEGYHGNVGVGDLWVIKMNSVGQIEWKRTLGGKSAEVEGADILQTPDGNYLIAGSAASKDCGMAGGHGGLDCWLVKLNRHGEIVWQKMIGGEYNEYVTSIDPTADGGYIIGGYSNSVTGTYSSHHGDNTTFDWWITKVDGNGNQLWQVILGGTLDDQCNSAQATPDGGAIATGLVWSTDGDVTGLNRGRADMMVVKIDNAGNVQWKKTYGGSQFDGGMGIRLTTDGGYIVAGYSGSSDGDVTGNHTGLGPFTDFWVVKLDNAGVIQWQKCYGGKFNETPHYIQKEADGGYILAGQAESPDGDVGCNAGLTDGWILKIDALGNKQWARVVGGNYYDQLASIQPLADGSYIVGATTCSMDLPGYHPTKPGGTNLCGDFWVLKLSQASPTPAAATVSISPAEAKVCAGTASTFTATVVNTGYEPSYHWTRNGVPVGGNDPRYTASDFKDNDVLAVSVQSATGVCDLGGSTASASLTVHLNTTVLHPDIKISTPTTVICDCAVVNYRAIVSGSGDRPNYQWMLNGIATGINKDNWLSNGITPTDMVTCSYTDSSGCIPNQPLISNAIMLTAGGPRPATVSIDGPKDAVCVGTSMTFTANPLNAGPSPSYQWTVNGVNAGGNADQFTSSSLNEGDVVNCQITPDMSFPCATAGNGASNPFTVHFTTKAAPLATIAASPATICSGHPVEFTATTQGAGMNPGYQWSVNGVPTGGNTQQFTTTGLVNGDAVECTVTVDPGFTCALQPAASSNTVVVTVVNQPDPSVTISSSVPAACSGSEIRFDADVENAGVGAQLQWLVNNGPNGATGPSFSSSGLADGAVVVCSVTPGKGACLSEPVSSNALVETIWPLPQAAIVPADTLVLFEGEATLRAGVSGDVTDYQWAPAAKLENAQSLSPTTIPLEDSVLYTLTVKTANQCTGKAMAVVHVYRALNMPSAFSPNGDGVNDLFRIPAGITMRLKEFAVFDRWGNRVFTTTNARIGWDGTVGGNPQPAGVYVYIVTGADLKGPVSSKGTVVLVR